MRTRHLCPRQERRLLPGGNTTVDKRTGHDRTEAIDRKHAVDGQAERCARAFFRRVQRQLMQRLAQRLDSLSRAGRGAQNGLSFQKCSPHTRFDVLFKHSEPFVIGKIRLRDDDKPALHAEKPQNVKMLDRLRHKALVRRHNEHREVDAARAGKHIFDEPLMPWHIDDTRTSATVEKSRRAEARSIT